MELVEYLRILKRRWFIVFLMTVLGAAAGWLTTPPASPQQDPMFRATHTLLADDSASTSRTAYLATVGEIPERAAERLGADPAELAFDVQLISNSQLGTLEITTVQPSAEEAVRIADGYAEALLEVLTERAVRDRAAADARAAADVDATLTRISELRAAIALDPENPALRAALNSETTSYEGAYARLQGIRGESPPGPGLMTVRSGTAVPATDGEPVQAPRSSQSSSREPSVQVFQGPDPGTDEPEVAEPAQPLPRAIAGGLIGFFLGIGLVLLLDRLDTKVRTMKGAEGAFGVPVLAEIPPLTRSQKRSPLVVLSDPSSAAAEGYRRLRTSLQLSQLMSSPEAHVGGGRSALDAQEALSVLITSAGPRDGKSSTVANLAAAFAEGGKVVLVFDCDLRRPAMHRFLRPSARPTLAEIRDQDGLPTLDDVATPTAVPNVWLVRVTDGAEAVRNPTEALGHLRQLIETARDHADVILLDTAPQLAVNDANDLLPQSDQVVIAARANATRIEIASRLGEVLRRVGAPIAGVVLIGATSPPSTYFDTRSRATPAGDPADVDSAESFTAHAPSKRRPPGAFHPVPDIPPAAPKSPRRRREPDPQLRP